MVHVKITAAVWGALVSLAVWLSPLEASAGIVYRAIAAKCTDSVRSLTSDWISEGAETQIDIVGPKVCPDKVTIELVMDDAYVPGEMWRGDEFTPTLVESFLFDDGVKPAFRWTRPQPCCSLGEFISVQMPVRPGPGHLILFFDDLYFEDYGGRWIFTDAFPVDDLRCGFGSIAGRGSDGYCAPLWLPEDALYMGRGGYPYGTEGTYVRWVRIPESGTLSLLALGCCAALPWAGRRRLGSRMKSVR